MPEPNGRARAGLVPWAIPVALMTGLTLLQGWQLVAAALHGAADLAWWDYLTRRMGQFKPDLLKPPNNAILVAAFVVASIGIACGCLLAGTRQPDGAGEGKPCA